MKKEDVDVLFNVVLVIVANIALLLFILASCCSCIQHELNYDYLVIEPNSIHAENLHYKQNVCLAKTDKQFVEAAFADIIKLKMDRSVQVPDPNTVEAVGGAGGKLIKEVAPLLIGEGPSYLEMHEYETGPDFVIARESQ